MEAVSKPILVTFVTREGEGSMGGLSSHDGPNYQKPHTLEMDGLVVKLCLTSIFKFYVHGFDTILKSDALTSHPRLSSPLRLNIVQVELEKHGFAFQNI